MATHKFQSSRPHHTTLLRKLRRILGPLFTYYVRYHGDKVLYLRHQGTKIGEGCDLLNHISYYGTEPWLIELGNRVTLTAGVMLLTHDASSRLFRDQLPGSSRYGNRFGVIVIQDDCFVGVNSIVLPGVTIGPRSIVGAGSVVTKDVPPETVVAGVPARHICTLVEYIENYKEKMILFEATNRESLRRELTLRLWGEER